MNHTFKIKTHHTYKKGRIFAWMGLFSSIGFSAFITVLAVTLAQTFQNDAYVGYFFSFIGVISLLTALASTILLRHFSKVAITKWTLFLGSIAFFLFTIAADMWHFLIFDVLRAICVTLFLIVLGIFVRDFAKNNQLALAEGRYYFFTNIGWFIGPFLGGYFAEYGGKETAFIFAGTSYLVTLMIFTYENIVMKNPHIHDEKETATFKEFLQNLKLFFQKKERIKSFFIGFGLYFWWAIYKIYIPVTIINIGFGQDVVGLVISLGMVPLILLEILISKKAQQNGVKKYLIFGYLWLALFIAAFIFTEIPLVLLALMILINIGTAFIEPLHEAYFFQMTDRHDEDRLYGIYSTSYPIANIITPLVGGIILSFTGINGLWVACAILFIIMAVIIHRK